MKNKKFFNDNKNDNENFPSGWHFSLFTFHFSLLICLAALILISCGNPQKELKKQLPGKADIISELKQKADIVTTELKVRKVAIYDSSKSEKFTWKNPNTWKWGDQKCIIPIEVTLKYGYDLRNLSIKNVEIEEDSSIVVIHLPKPKIIDAGYNTYIDEKSIVKMSTGLRSEVGHALQEEIRRKGYEAVLKDDLVSSVGDDVKRNAQTLFTSIVKSMGWEHVVVEVE